MTIFTREYIVDEIVELLYNVFIVYGRDKFLDIELEYLKFLIKALEYAPSVYQ